MESRKHLLLPLTVAIAITGLVAWVAVRPLWRGAGWRPPGRATAPEEAADFRPAVEAVDARLQRQWTEAGIEPAVPAEDLQVLRRLALALVGTVPSLEEIRRFESDSAPDRVQQWAVRYIADSRFVEYFAARLADAYLDPDVADLQPHQRDRLTRWIGGGLQQGRPYGELVREMIAGRGVLADRPGTLVVAAELSLGDQAAERLAARTARAFLGQRIDCAQCHDHPFAEWRQSQFEGLAAYYGQVQFRSAFVQDTRARPFVVDDPNTQEQRTVEPRVPFDAQWVADARHLRPELAGWVTHPENRRFRRAIANRAWGLMFGRAYSMPVDDLADPGPRDDPGVLDLLADDLAAHGDDLRRLVQVIASTRAFNLASSHPGLDDDASAAELEQVWGVFPVTELGPHQMIRSMQQAAAARTIRAEDSSVYGSIRRYEREFRFVEDYGIAGDAEDAQASTIPHTVDRLSGRDTRQFSKGTWFSAPGRIAWMSGDASTCLDNCYLVCLTRRPTDAERAHFLPPLEGDARRRGRTVEDVYWTLYNSAEFNWNH